MLILCILIFAIAYMVKGGWLGKIKGWDDWVQSLPSLLSRVLQGKFLAGLIVFTFSILSSFDIGHSVLILCAWLLAVSPSMGEEAGAIGRMKTWWGDYKDAIYPPWHDDRGTRVFDRSYGVLKGVQRGAWIGSMFVLFCGSSVLSIPIMAIGFVAAHFIGQEIYYRIHGSNSWAYAEPLVGALIGICLYI